MFYKSPSLKNLNLTYKVLREAKNTCVGSIRHICDFRYRIGRILLEHSYEKRFGIETSEPHIFKDKVSLYKDEAQYFPTPYNVLEKIIEYLKLRHGDVFIDMGCGKGRVAFFVGTQRLKKIIGIELRKEISDAAKRNLNSLKINNTPIEIFNADIISFNVAEGTVFFMYNPFGCQTFVRAIDKIKDSLIMNPRKVRIVYYGEIYRGLLDSQDWLEPEGEIIGAHTFVWRNKDQPFSRTGSKEKMEEALENQISKI